jgi:hypothetical protein
MCLLAALVMTGWACSDDDDWTPGPVVESNQVSFTTGSPDQVEIYPNSTCDFSFTLTRDDATTAVSVPLSVSDPENYSCPSTVEFAAGEASKDIQISFKGNSEAGVYDCTVEIPEGAFNSPYTAKTSSITLSVLVAKWVLVIDKVRFYGASILSDWYAPLYQLEGQDLYRFVGFMQNYDLTFKLNPETGEMSPQGGSWDGDYWCFSPDQWESYPLYLNEEEAYIDYCALYAPTGQGYNKIYPQGDPNYDGAKWGMITPYYSKYKLDGTLINSAYEYVYMDWE